MCFAPQRRALFRHLNLQKWSVHGVLCTFWLRNVLRATTACTFSTSQLPKVVREWCVLYILTWKCASRHNGVQFFISPLASWLRTRRFSEPTFRPSGATNHWKNTVNRDFSYLFAHLHLLSSYSFSSTLLSSDLSLLSASALLCFSPVHIVGSLTSKLFFELYILLFNIIGIFIPFTLICVSDAVIIWYRYSNLQVNMIFVFGCLWLNSTNFTVRSCSSFLGLLQGEQQIAGLPPVLYNWESE